MLTTVTSGKTISRTTPITARIAHRRGSGSTPRDSLPADPCAPVSLGPLTIDRPSLRFTGQRAPVTHAVADRLCGSTSERTCVSKVTDY
jgi:hypothetical protein